MPALAGETKKKERQVKAGASEVWNQASPTNACLSGPGLLLSNPLCSFSMKLYDMWWELGTWHAAPRGIAPARPAEAHGPSSQSFHCAEGRAQQSPHGIEWNHPWALGLCMVAGQGVVCSWPSASCCCGAEGDWPLLHNCVPNPCYLWEAQQGKEDLAVSCHQRRPGLVQRQL
jgi:hypothetical protein